VVISREVNGAHARSRDQRADHPAPARPTASRIRSNFGLPRPSPAVDGEMPWIFHCHVPHHTPNKMMPGYHGAPVDMTRVFHYETYRPVPLQYFSFQGSG